MEVLLEKLAVYDGHGNVIWFSNWLRSVGVDVEGEMIWSLSVVCVVGSYGLGRRERRSGERGARECGFEVASLGGGCGGWEMTGGGGSLL